MSHRRFLDRSVLWMSLLLAPSVCHPFQCPTVNIGGNLIRGYPQPDTGGADVCRYRGIQYATADRWQAPQPTAAQTARDGWGPVCPQPAGGQDQVQGEEECLFLNIWTPRGLTEGSRTVMVFIHGGGFLVGSGSLFDGQYFASHEDVVFVTLNYRLGALGFLAFDGTDNGTHFVSTGNFGILDQQVALEWLRDRIHLFGGDKDKIMVFGESAGAMSISLHLTSTQWGQDQSWPFRAAAMESNLLGLPYKTLDEGKQVGTWLQQSIPSGNMHSATTKEIVNAQYSVIGEQMYSLNALRDFLVWAPVIDGTVIRNQPATQTLPLDHVPTLIGTNRDEGFIFAKIVSSIPYRDLLHDLFHGEDQQIANLKRYAPTGHPEEDVNRLSNVIGDYLFTCGTRHVVNRSVSSEHGAFVYQFTHVPAINTEPYPGCTQRVCHGAEIPFVFHRERSLSGSQETALAARMAGYWSSFAKNLTPGSTPIAWPAYTTVDGNYLDLGLQISQRRYTAIAQVAQCAFWEGLGFGQSRFFIPKLSKEAARGDAQKGVSSGGI